MAVYVDPLRSYAQQAKSGGKYFGNGKQSCHTACDGDDIEELHAFAKKIGLQIAWFQSHPTMPHYDLTPNRRRMAVAAGAIELGSFEFVRKCSKVFRDRPVDKE